MTPISKYLCVDDFSATGTREIGRALQLTPFAHNREALSIHSICNVESLYTRILRVLGECVYDPSSVQVNFDELTRRSEMLNSLQKLTNGLIGLRTVYYPSYSPASEIICYLSEAANM